MAFLNGAYPWIADSAWATSSSMKWSFCQTSLQKWWALVTLLGTAAGQSHYNLHPRTVAGIDAGHSSPDLIYEPSLEYVSKPGYAFAYGVEDPYSGNAQSHQEERDGDVVRGEYKVMEPDGSVRTVTYTVDPKHGFQANVQHSDPDMDAPFSAYSSRQQLQSRASSPGSGPGSSPPAGPAARAHSKPAKPTGSRPRSPRPQHLHEDADFFAD